MAWRNFGSKFRNVQLDPAGGSSVNNVLGEGIGTKGVHSNLVATSGYLYAHLSAKGKQMLLLLFRN